MKNKNIGIGPKKPCRYWSHSTKNPIKLDL